MYTDFYNVFTEIFSIYNATQVGVSNENFLWFFIIFYCKTDGTKQENFQIHLKLMLHKLACEGAYRVDLRIHPIDSICLPYGANW